MKGYRLHQARYIDPAKRQIEVTWHKDVDIHSEDMHLIVDVIEHDEEHPEFQKLMRHTTLEKIHEMTVEAMRKERKAFEQTVIDIAKREGIIDGNVDKTEMYYKYSSFIFSERKEDDEDLFALKLALFDLDCVKDCKDRAMKSALRKSTSPVGAMKAAIEIYEAGK